MSELRRIVLDASLNLIDEKGLQGLSLRAVSRRANVSHQAPYHHFGSKQGLLAALVEEGFALLNTRFEQAVRSSASPLSALEAVGLAYVRFAADHRGHFRLMFRSDVVDLAEYPEAQQQAQAATQALEDVVHSCQQAGHGSHLDAEAFTHFAWSAVHGAACLVADGPQTDTMRARAESVSATLSILLLADQGR